MSNVGKDVDAKKRTRRGFTLIELMVVILILAILAALIVPRLFGQQDQAKIAKAQADISELKNALARFRVDNDRFPTDQEGLTALQTAPSDCPHWNGPYVENLPQDPWHGEYQYHDLGNNDVEITSYGKDGAPGGGDDISSLDSGASTSQ
ncbi:MAG TPA: type II secretion system major pseudopilin GspG [Fimbriimonadaceae bacterium]|nr:type II secretion system major pseudopilin GspG [Fimbriimonadaceae bacterium]